MSNYAIHDATGFILRTISCQPEHIDAQLQEGENALECDARWHDRIDVASGTVIPQEKPNPFTSTAPAYVQAREAAYPPVSAQLDMLWHAMDTGEIPKAQAWFDLVAAVKSVIPKDGEGEPTLVYTVDAIPEGDDE
jgi:hypothetical protein